MTGTPKDAGKTTSAPYTLEEISTQMGLLTLIQIPCHHVLVNEIDLNLKYCIGLKQFF